MRPGTRRTMTVTASTKRNPAVSGGKIGTAVTQVASLKCTPLDPVDAEARARCDYARRSRRRPASRPVTC
jgi:hypothetical protein